jgi:hypothetical protein
MLGHHAGNQHATIFIGSIQTHFSNSHISLRTWSPLKMKQSLLSKLWGIYCTATRRHPRRTHFRFCVLAEENSNTVKLVYYPRMTDG